MADSVKSYSHLYSHASFFAVFLLIFLLSSCSPADVLIISDPYIELIQGETWGPLSWFFKFKARIVGYRIRGYQAESNEEILEIINERESQPDIVIFSPWTAASLNNLPVSDSKIIVAGGYSSLDVVKNTESQIHSIVPERTDVMKQLGELAVSITKETGKPAFALFNAETDVQKREMNSILEAFQENDLLILRDIAGSGTRQMPADFNQLAADASVLLLFSGPYNTTALAASDDFSVPVITEYLSGSSAWYNRIIATVEDNPAALRKALLTEIRSDNPEELHYYPARMVKGDLFSSVSR